MNLQEALNYRNKCVICQREMTLKVDKVADHLKISKTKDGVKISSEYKNGITYLFKFDGTYERGEYYSNPFIIKKHCPVCVSPVTNNKTILLKGRAVGMTTRYSEYTTLENIKKQGCFYSFSLYTDNCGIYETKLLTDNIRYCNKKEFWHLNTDFTVEHENKSMLYNAKFEDTIGSVLTLLIPAVNTANIKNKEQFVSKFKLYSLFS